MTDWPAFVAAVVAAPDDDLVRLVAADWLEENRQPEQAEFLRVQVELAKLPATLVQKARQDVSDPSHSSKVPPRHWAQFDRIVPLAVREDSLLREHWKDWAPELGDSGRILDNFLSSFQPPDGNWVRFSFTRGFVSQITLSWSDWQQHAAALLESCPLTGRDARVRLTTWPDGPYMHPLHMRPELTETRPEYDLRVLADIWPGVRFKLPQAGRGNVIVDSQFVQFRERIERLSGFRLDRQSAAFRVGRSRLPHHFSD
jgi:uncharacterized protein (TIGR02996 family)